MMEQVIDIPQQDVITKDNATVTVDGLAFYQVFDAAKASYEVTNLDSGDRQADHDQYPLGHGRDGSRPDAVASRRDQRAAAARGRRRGRRPWGVKVNRIEIKDIVPPRGPGAVDGPADEGRAREARRDPQAEGQRQSAILKAEGQKQSQILEAEGRREAAFRDAEARERLAQAEAKATEMVSEAVARGDVAALNYFVAREISQGVRQARAVAEPEDADPADGGDRRARLARRHRRDRQGDVRRRLGAAAAASGPPAPRGRPDRRRRASDLPARRRRHEGASPCGRLSRALGGWNWFDRRRRSSSCSSCWRRAPSCCGSGSPRCWSAIISLASIWSWQAQLIAFAVFALASIPLWRRFARQVERPVDRPFLNRRAEAFVGRVFTLEKPIVDGVGTVRIEDTMWRVGGPDVPAGSRVKVVRADGATWWWSGVVLAVIPAERSEDRKAITTDWAT